jgi:carboxyl-terminal processing protease
MQRIIPAVLAAAILTSGLTSGEWAGLPHAPQAVKQQPVVAALPASARAAELRRQSFEKVWRTINEKHFDPTFGGVNWERVRQKYAPLVAAAASDQESHRLLQQMLGELRQSHFAIIPPEAVGGDGDSAFASGGSGVDLRLIDDQAVITRVIAGSPADRAGLRPGFIITQIDGTPVEAIAGKLQQSTESAARKRLRLTRLIQARVGGAPGSTAKLICLDAGNQRREFALLRETLKGELSPRFGNFPPQLTEFEVKRLPNGFGYIRFNIFVAALMDKIRPALLSMKDAPGIIFDLRGNPGGMGGMAAGIAGHLFSKEASLGTMRMRAGHQNFAIFPQANVYTGPVAILIDGQSGSTSEVFAAGMQEVGRAVIVGETSQGAALPSIFDKLPTGALFQYAIADFRTPKGVLVEGRGVIPDVLVKWNRAALLSGRDAMLEAAVLKLRQSARLAK